MKRSLLLVAATLTVVFGLASAGALASDAVGGAAAPAPAGRPSDDRAPDGRGRPDGAGRPTTTTTSTTVVEEPPLRLNHLQSRGTHNSTHLDPGWMVTDGAPFGWGYSHRTLTGQLEEQGVRQVEIDVHWNWAKDDFDVYHVWFGDDRTTCDTLTGCLAELKAWSDDHPGHAPLMVLVEPKDGRPPELPEDGDPFAAPFDDHAYERLDEILLASFGDRALLPDDVTTPGKPLRDSILEDGWPTLDAVRQHALFVMDGDDHSTRYSKSYSSLAGRTMFVQAPENTAVAAFVGRDGARLPGEDKYGRMARVVAQGFMVRDLVSPGPEADAAKTAGAHFLSTDDPDDLVLSDDPAAPSRCNPITTVNVTCDDLMIERHEPDGYDVPDDPADTPDQVVADKVDRWVVGSADSLAAIAAAEPGSRVPPAP